MHFFEIHRLEECVGSVEHVAGYLGHAQTFTACFREKFQYVTIVFQMALND